MEEEIKMIKKLENIVKELQDIIINAPMEKDCNKIENDMFADMENLIESTQNYLEYLRSL